MRTLTAIAASAILLAAPAHAGHVEFHYSASELASAAGVERLYNRIEQQAMNICSNHDSRELWRVRAVAACAAQTTGDVVDAIGDSRLRALHAETAADRFAAR